MSATRITMAMLLALCAGLNSTACAVGEPEPPEPQVVLQARRGAPHRLIHDSIQVVASSPDRTRIVYVTHCADGVGTALRAFDLETRAGRLLALGRFDCVPPAAAPTPGSALQPWQLLGPGSATFSPDGEHVVFVAADGGMGLFSFATRAKTRLGDLPGLHAFSPDGARLAFTQPDPATGSPFVGAVLVRELAAGTTTTLAPAGAMLAQFVAGGQRLLYFTDVDPMMAGSLHVWDFAAAASTPVASGVALPITLSGDGTTAVFPTDVGAPDPTSPMPTPVSATLAWYHVPTGALRVVEATTGLMGIYPSDDGRTVAFVTGLDFATFKATLKVWRAGAGVVAIDPDLAPLLSGGPTAALSPAGDTLAFARFPGVVDPSTGVMPQPEVVVHELASGASTVLQSGIPSQFVQLRFSPRGGTLLYSWQPFFPFPVATLAAWDVATGVTAVIEESGNPAHITFVPDDSAMVFIGSESLGGDIGDLKVYDPATRVVTVLAPSVYQYAASADVRTLAYQAAQAPGDPTDPTVILGRVRLGEAAPTIVDATGPTFSTVLVGARHLAWVKPDGLWVD